MKTSMLRNLVKDDLPVLFEQQLDPTANHMAAFTGKNPSNREAFDRHWSKILSNDAIIKRTILFKNNVAGSIIKYEMIGKPEITYWLGAKYWGKGLATKALSELLNEINIHPLYARTAHDNIASIRVLEKCNFTKTEESTFFANARGK